MGQDIRLGKSNQDAETMSLTKKFAKILETVQRPMETTILGISLRDRIRNTEIKCKTKVKDIVKLWWIGYMPSYEDNRWTRRILEWRPWEKHWKTSKKRMGDMWPVTDKRWMRLAKNRERWKQLRETYIQEWMDRGWQRRR